ncbi:MAG: zinc metalloprotease [Bacteroidia bacterium]|nr:zinc metalloprotease [Bacteroidia bacterium]
MRTTFLTILTVGLVWAQSQRFIRCATMEVDSLMRAQYPDWPSMDDYEPLMRQKVDRAKALYEASRTIGGVYRIPVVVHVIHSGGAVGSGDNIPTANILHQIEVLNEDFRRKLGTPGWNDDPRGADTRIEFVLAKRDPNGNPTDGINRVAWNSISGLTSPPPYNTPTIQASIKPATQWDPERYFNIWVVQMSGGILGYAQFPDLTGLLGMPGDGPLCTQDANTDGVVVLPSAFGSVLKGSTGLAQPYVLGRTATHEVGHWLGLRHTWGDNSTAGECAPDDYCNDTPNCADQLYGCSLGAPSCEPGVRRMVENYMDYSDDPCFNIFTLEQALRMRITLEYAPRRRSLLTSPALIPPTTTDAALIDLPIPQDLCSGTYNIPVVLRNNGTTSLNSIPVKYRINNGPWQTQTWTGTLNPGNQVTFNLTGINFTTPGTYTFTACTDVPGDGDRSEDTTSTQFLVHNGFYPLYQDFEFGWGDQGIPPGLWRVVNPDNDCYTWRTSGCIGSSGAPTMAMYINLYSDPTAGRRDAIHSPLIDLTNAPAGVALTFDLAYWRRGAIRDDTLDIQVSTDCGITWTNLTRLRSADSLTTVTGLPPRCIPTADTQWQSRNISLDAYRGQKIRIRFVSRNGRGNCIWIDNVRVGHQPMVFWADSGQIIREELSWPLLSGDCRRYRDIEVPVRISAAPSAAVQVNVQVGPGSSAREGVDFSILTPTLTFPAGSTSPVNARIRVYDDQAIENTRLALLSLSIANGPATVAADKNPYKLWISDNDLFPPEVLIFYEDFEGGDGGFTTYAISNSTGANRWVRGNAGLPTGHSFYISRDPSATPPPYRYDTSSTSRFALASRAINTQGYTNLILSFDVRVGGQYDNGGSLRDFGRVFYTTTAPPSSTPAAAYTPILPAAGCGWGAFLCPGSNFPRTFMLAGKPDRVVRVTVPLPSGAENQPQLYLVWRWDNSANRAGVQPPIAIDNIALYGRKTPAIETNTASTRVYPGPEDSLYAYSPSNHNLILSLVNQSATDFGCLDVQIDRTGTGAVALRPGHPTSAHVTQKTYLITSTRSVTGPYAITLYYTNDEVTGYQTATGRTWDTHPSVVKTAGSITSEAMAPSPTFAMSPIRAVGTYGGGSWIRGTFSSFSGFAVGDLSSVTTMKSAMAEGFFTETPFRETLTFRAERDFGGLELQTITGSIVYQVSGSFTAGTYMLNTADLPVGLYLLVWRDNAGQVLSHQKVLHLP